VLPADANPDDRVECAIPMRVLTVMTTDGAVTTAVSGATTAVWIGRGTATGIAVVETSVAGATTADPGSGGATPVPAVRGVTTGHVTGKAAGSTGAATTSMTATVTAAAATATIAPTVLAGTTGGAAMETSTGGIPGISGATIARRGSVVLAGTTGTVRVVVSTNTATIGAPDRNAAFPGNPATSIP